MNSATHPGSVSSDYYQVLGLPRDANDQELKSAYRKLALKYHPDRNPGDHAAEEAFKSASEAYQCLCDKEKRKAYDRLNPFAMGNRNFVRQPAPEKDVVDVVFETVKEAPAAKPSGPVIRGEDISARVFLTLEEVLTGTRKDVTVRRAEVCPICQGAGRDPLVRSGQVDCPGCEGQTVADDAVTITITIPPGTDTGVRVYCKGAGNAGPRGGPRGDLFVLVAVQQHRCFKRKETHIYTDLPVSFVQTILGDEIRIAGLNGPILIPVPAGSKHGDKIRIRGKGVPYKTIKVAGDLIVKLAVELPEDLNDEQIALLTRFEETTKVDNIPLFPSGR